MIFKDKVAFVTGAGSGIGKAAAEALAAEGARVAVCDISMAAAEVVAGGIAARGGTALAVQGDVGNAASVDAALDRVVAAFGGLDMAVNNAGIGSARVPLTELSEEHFDRVMAVNLKGVWLCMRRQIPLMQARGGGAIVNTASALGLVALPNSSEYIAAKHGVVGLTRAAAMEFSAKGVRINAVCPGCVDTPLISESRADAAMDDFMRGLHPIGRLATSEEIAAAIIWLLSPQASFMTGTAMPVDGGWTAH